MLECSSTDTTPRARLRGIETRDPRDLGTGRVHTYSYIVAFLSALAVLRLNRFTILCVHNHVSSMPGLEGELTERDSESLRN